MITDERRAFTRISCVCTIRYHSVASGRSFSGISLSRNISTGGVFFESLTRFDPGDVVDCWIDLPEHTRGLHFLSRVVRCEEIDNSMVCTYGVAVEFVKSYNSSDIQLKKITSA